MTAIDTLCFDDFDPVAGGTGPNLDGFFFHDIGMEDPALVEMGYTRGCRYTWSGGSEPLAMFQGVKAGNFLVFGFFARFDKRFDNNDKIIIAIKPAGGSVLQQRRIDVNPVNARSPRTPPPIRSTVAQGCRHQPCADRRRDNATPRRLARGEAAVW